MLRGKKGQASLEYLMTAGFLILLIIPTVFVFYNYAIETSQNIDLAQADRFARHVISSAETVYYLGSPSRIVIEETFPQNVVGVGVLQDPVTKTNLFSIALQGRRGITNLSYSTPVPITGTFQNFASGTRKIRIEASPDIAGKTYAVINLAGEGMCLATYQHDTCVSDVLGNDEDPLNEFYCFNGQLINNCEQCGCPTPIGGSELDCRIETGECIYPVVESIDPVMGESTGGLPVTIYGYDFYAGAQVKFGSFDALGEAVNPEGTQITAITPIGPVGLVDVTVINPNGGAGTLPKAFRFIGSNFLFNEPGGTTVARIDDFGNLDIVGEVKLSYSSSGSDFKIISGATVFALTPIGDLYMIGTLHEEQSSITPSAQDEFIVSDSFGEPIALFNQNGDIYLKGTLNENAVIT